MSKRSSIHTFPFYHPPVVALALLLFLMTAVSGFSFHPDGGAEQSDWEPIAGKSIAWAGGRAMLIGKGYRSNCPAQFVCVWEDPEYLFELKLRDVKATPRFVVVTLKGPKWQKSTSHEIFKTGNEYLVNVKLPGILLQTGTDAVFQVYTSRERNLKEYLHAEKGDTLVGLIESL